jgi:hypothetical protein
MKKLRLIKPWRLRTVRQRLEMEEVEAKNILNKSISCPPCSQAEEVFIFRNALIYKTVRYSPYEGPENPNNAPFSDAIFAWITKENSR